MSQVDFKLIGTRLYMQNIKSYCHKNHVKLSDVYCELSRRLHSRINKKHGYIRNFCVATTPLSFVRNIIEKFNNNMKGPISYRTYYLSRTVMEKRGTAYNHNEVLEILKSWYQLKIKSNQPKDPSSMPQVNSATCIALATNYPYMYKVKKPHYSINDYKVIIIPPLDYHSRDSIGLFRRTVLKDQYAHICELLQFTSINNFNYTKANVLKLNIEGVHTLIDFERWLKMFVIQNQHKDSFDRTHFTTIPNLEPYKYDIELFLNSRVDKSIQSFANANMRNCIPLKNLMQGRNSLIRSNIPRKIKAYRSQILLRPELEPNQLILPYTWQKKLKFPIMPLIDVSSKEPIDKKCFYRMTGYRRLVIKRDPCIDAGSVVFINEIGFALSESIYISPGIINYQNADFDGDGESIFQIKNSIASLESEIKVNPKFNMYTYQRCRISFTESDILYMHQRRLPKSHKYYRLYCSISQYCTYSWLNDSSNYVLIDGMKKYGYPFSYKFVEPTKEILETVLLSIYQLYGSCASYQFYNEIKLKTLEIANGEINEYHSKKLPSDYLMSTNLLNTSLLRIAMSGSKGNLYSYMNLLNKLYDNDKTTVLNASAIPLDASMFNKQLEGVNKDMAQCSKNVSILGHKFFKTNIEFDLLNFANNKFYYRDEILHNDSNFLFAIQKISPVILDSIIRLDHEQKLNL